MKATRAEISVEFTSKTYAEAVYRALKPETKHSIGPRSKVTIVLEGKSLQIAVSAKDISALRAAINSYLRWVSGSAELIQVASYFEQRSAAKRVVSAKTAM